MLLTLHPYFRIKEGKQDQFDDLVKRFAAATGDDPNCYFYGFSKNSDGTVYFCREGYNSAQAVLDHLAAVGALLEESADYATLERAEVKHDDDAVFSKPPTDLYMQHLTSLQLHGPASELEKLKGNVPEILEFYEQLDVGFERL